MSLDDEGYVAHPRLYGAPAYARPPVRVTPTELPVDPDDLPISAYLSPDEAEMVETLRAKPFGVATKPAPEAAPEVRTREAGLTALAGRLLRRES